MFALRTIILLFGLGLISTALSAQKAVDNLYKDQLEPKSKLVEGTFQTTLEKTKEGNYVKKIYYPETKQVTHFITYSDRKAGTRNGPYYEWFDNGQPWKTGQYTEGTISGEWVYYRFNGSWSTGSFVDGEYQGEWKIYRKDKTLEESKFYGNGKLNGPRTYYDTTGVVVKIETYANDELVSTDFVTASPANDSMVTVELEPEELPIMLSCAEIEDKDERKKCSDSALLKAIYSSIKYPQDAIYKGYEGMALFSFVVEKDGSCSDVTTLRGVSRSIEKECLRIINLLPTWKAGEQHGKPVRVQFNLPVKFQLE